MVKLSLDIPYFFSRLKPAELRDSSLSLRMTIWYFYGRDGLHYACQAFA